MAKRVCRRCPTLVPADAYKGMCDQCRRDWDKARGSRTERGYGPDHEAERDRIQKLIDAGITIRCWRCDTSITGRDWHLDHNEDRTTWRGPSCSSCNLHKAGRASHGLPPQPLP